MLDSDAGRLRLREQLLNAAIQAGPGVVPQTLSQIGPDTVDFGLLPAVVVGLAGAGCDVVERPTAAILRDFARSRPPPAADSSQSVSWGRPARPAYPR
jgi:hypothetical protein